MNRRFRTHAPWIAVALAAIAVYANSLANGFAWDDHFIIFSNTRIHQLADQSRIWLTPYWQTYGTELGLYRPFAMFAYALEWAAGGGSPLMFHATNVALHAIASVLAFFLLRVLSGSVAGAVVGALLFAVHPVRTEAVANGVGQAELIAGAATLAACLIYATRPSGAATGWGRRIAIIVLFAVAILSKESAIVLPGLLVALDVAQRRVVFSRRSVIEYVRAVAVPLVLLVAGAILYLALRIEVIGSLGGVNAGPGLPFLRGEHRVYNALRAWPEYVRLLFFPVDLVADYAPAVILPVQGFTPMVLLGLALLVGTVLLAVLTPLAPGAGLAAAWFLIAIMPVSNLLIPIGVVVAERLLYTPAFAVSLIAAYAWRPAMNSVRLRGRWPRRTAYATVAVVLFALAARTVIRNPDWKHVNTVFRSIVRSNPESYRAWAMTGAIFAARGEHDRAFPYFKMAYRIWPDDGQLATDLAAYYIGNGEYQPALDALERLHDHIDWFSLTEVLLAQAAIGVGNYERALAAVIQADRLGAPHIITYPLYARAYEGLGFIDKAVAAYRVSVEKLGGSAASWSLLARALAIHGDLRGAAAALDSADARTEASDTTTARVVSELHVAIESGCYARMTDAPPEGCADPVEIWRVMLPRPALSATKLQDATKIDPATGSAAPGSGL